MTCKQKSVESLIIVLQTGNDANRCFAAQALGNIGDIQAVKPLMSALHDEDEDVVRWDATHDGYVDNFNRIIKRKLTISKHHPAINGEDSIWCHK